MDDHGKPRWLRLNRLQLIGGLDDSWALGDVHYRPVIQATPGKT
jgi:hypothetical protein